MSDQQEKPEGAKAKMPVGKKVGLGVALVVLPVAAFQAYRHVEKASEEKDKGVEKGVSYDVAALRQVDGKLVKWREAMRIDTGLKAPEAIAVGADGTVLAAGDGVIRRFGREGKTLTDIKLSGTATTLAVHADGTIFAAIRDRIEVYDAHGERVAAWKSFGEKAYVTSIAAAGEDVWIADAGRRTVVHCRRDGTVVGEIGKKDDARGIPGFQIPSEHMDVAIGADSLIWVANTGMHRLEAYTPDGNLERYWGQVGNKVEEFFGCCNPSDFHLLSDGSFVTSEKGIARVKRYLADGRFDCVVAPPNAFGDNRAGIDVASDADGRVLLLERGAKVIRVMVPAEGGTT